MSPPRPAKSRSAEALRASRYPDPRLCGHGLPLPESVPSASRYSSETASFVNCHERFLPPGGSRVTAPARRHPLRHRPGRRSQQARQVVVVARSATSSSLVRSAPARHAARERFASQRGGGTSVADCLRGSKRVYAGSTRLSFEVFARHRRGADSPKPCDFARLAKSSGDTSSVLVMKGSPVRVRASALPVRRCLARVPAPNRRRCVEGPVAR
jgi:hypothetical protein